MAMRVSYERGLPLTFQDEVSYVIRFEDKTTPRTSLKYVTDGILIRECVSDPMLQTYDVVILDEAHERSLYTDVLFGLIKKAVI
jgi:HrpA-like RNA helicase